MSDGLGAFPALSRAIKAIDDSVRTRINGLFKVYVVVSQPSGNSLVVRTGDPESMATWTINCLQGLIVNPGDKVLVTAIGGASTAILNYSRSGATKDIPGVVPAGGGSGSKLSKLSGFDYGVGWVADTSPTIYAKRTTNNVPNSSNTVDVTVTELTVPIPANEVWEIEWHLQVGSAGSGVRVGLTASNTALTRAVARGMGATPTAVTSEVFDFTLTSAAQYGLAVFCGANRADGWIQISSCVSSGANPSTATLRLLAWANGSTATIYKNSYVSARKMT